MYSVEGISSEKLKKNMKGNLSIEHDKLITVMNFFSKMSKTINKYAN